MRIKSLTLLLVLAMIFVCLAGCDISFTDPVLKRRESISNFLEKDVAGEIGETYNTKWFKFTIQSIDKVSTYKDHTAKAGFQLYQASITIKSTSEENIPMGTFDFYMDAPDFDEYIWSLPPLDDSMMPEKYDLKPDETVNYTMVFEVPADTAELALLYTESHEGGKDGAAFAFLVDGLGG
ncbi:MAG: DUF4352 domain-containing protein [Oscillospiraceae bacterium]|nr:DUF4352 domain-containing protein [Oscillospiraceae bacterium]